MTPSFDSATAYCLLAILAHIVSGDILTLVKVIDFIKMTFIKDGLMSQRGEKKIENIIVYVSYLKGPLLGYHFNV